MTSRLKSSILKASVAVIGLAALAGCATNPQEAINIAKPKTPPARNLTNFSESLRCMDRLFLQFDRSDMVITSAGIPDATEVISAGTKDMLISAISRMSRQSDAFTFVDYDATQTDVHELQGLAGFDEDFLIPDFYIRGAITQFDEGVLDESVGFSAGYEANFGRSEEIEDGKFKRKGVISYGASADANQNVAVVSLDLNVADLSTRQIISGISAHNSIAVSRTSVLGGFGGQISKLGANFAIELNRSEGLHQAVRTLIELSTIEVLGKLAEVPFWRCLEIDHTNPAVVAEAREWFEGMDEDERIEFVQTTLASKGGYGGQVSGVMDDDTQDAVARYQAQNDLIADGRINFDLYASLLNQEAGVGAVVAKAQPVALRTVQVKPAAAVVVEEIEDDEEEEEEEEEKEDVVSNEDDDESEDEALTLLLVSNEGADGTFKANRELHISAQTNQDAFVYCYYADAKGQVARIFPNQFQTDNLLPAGEIAHVPGEAGFDIVLDQAGADEKVACVASTEDLGLQLPNEYQMPDLQPFQQHTLDDIIEAYEDIDEDDMVLARLDVKIR